MILNQQRRVSVSMGLLRRFLSRARRALRLPPGSLTVCLVTDAQMARWNRAYRSKPGPTDVLSFPAEVKKPKRGRHGAQPRRRGLRPSAWFAGADFYLGDIAIAPGVARRNARRFGRTFNDEMRILLLHGMLHLMGYDHESDTGQMDRREQRLRRTLGLA
jgi:probable rRNA maturation factor